MWKRKNSSFFSSGLTEIRQKHNSIFSCWRRICSHRLQQPRQETGDLPSNYSACIYSLTQCLWLKPPGKTGNGPILRPLRRMDSTWGTVASPARRACNISHDIQSFQQTLPSAFITAQLPFCRCWGVDGGGTSAAVQKNSLLYSHVQVSSLLGEKWRRGGSP